MKLTIRKGVWETNSSSMHSIVVMKEPEKYTHEEMLNDLCLDENGIWKYLYRNDMCFGRYPFKILTSFSEKVLYAIANYGYYNHGTYKAASKKVTDIIDIVKKLVPELTDIDWPLNFEDAYTDQEGNPLEYDDLIWVSDTKYGKYGGYGYRKDGELYPAIKDDDYEIELCYYGEIDHQSAGLLDNFLNKESITLKDFLIGKQYIVVIDGDEYCDWLHYKAMRIIDLTRIDHEYR